MLTKSKLVKGKEVNHISIIEHKFLSVKENLSGQNILLKDSFYSTEKSTAVKSLSRGAAAGAEKNQ
jgi:hypothetical protein